MLELVPELGLESRVAARLLVGDAQLLERRGVPTYVYKGLGFFEADETQDVVALMRYLAEPTSDLRAAAFLRSRIVRLSDAGLLRLRPALAGAVSSEREPAAWAGLSVEDQTVLSLVLPPKT